MFALFTIDGLDQICGDRAAMRREARDLAAMGFDVWFYEYNPEAIDMESWADENHGKRPSPRMAGIIGNGKLPARD